MYDNFNYVDYKRLFWAHCLIPLALQQVSTDAFFSVILSVSCLRTGIIHVHPKSKITLGAFRNFSRLCEYTPVSWHKCSGTFDRKQDSREIMVIGGIYKHIPSLK